MFDATKGQQAVTDQVETRSDEFAARFNELPPRQQLRMLEQFNQLLDNPDQVSSFQAGTFAQNSAGQPAAQLGAGTTTATQTNAQDGLQAILNDGAVDPGIKLALRRVLTPTDPGYLPVDREGTPTELVATRQQRDTARTERDAARGELVNERDAARNGSLAKLLADVTAERDAARAAAGGYDQTTARQRLGEVDEAIDDLVGKMGGRVEGRNELKQKLNTLLSIIHLSRA